MIKIFTKTVKAFRYRDKFKLLQLKVQDLAQHWTVTITKGPPHPLKNH